MIDLRWLTNAMVEVLRWQVAHPGADDPEAPDVPLAGRRVWSAFLALHAGRGAGGFGPAPISHAEIESYGRVQRDPLRPFEIDIVRTLDQEWMKATAEKAENAGKSREDEVGPPMTPDLFRAVFKGERPPARKQMSGDDVMGFFRGKANQ